MSARVWATRRAWQRVGLMLRRSGRWDDYHRNEYAKARKLDRLDRS